MAKIRYSDMVGWNVDHNSLLLPMSKFSAWRFFSFLHRTNVHSYQYPWAWSLTLSFPFCLTHSSMPKLWQMHKLQMCLCRKICSLGSLPLPWEKAIPSNCCIISQILSQHKKCSWAKCNKEPSPARNTLEALLSN